MFVHANIYMNETTLVNLLKLLSGVFLYARRHIFHLDEFTGPMYLILADKSGGKCNS